MNTSARTASLLAGCSLAAMAVLAPIGVMVALPSGETGAAALIMLVVACLDVVIGVALFVALRGRDSLLVAISAGMRIAFAAVLAVAAGSLAAPADVDRFHAVWEMRLFLFAVHLALVGAAMMRADQMPTWIGILVFIAGLGYAADAASLALWPANPLSLGEFLFVGEVVLLVWLIGWGGRDLRSIPARRMVASA